MLSVGMQRHLLQPYRQLAWLARFERPPLTDEFTVAYGAYFVSSNQGWTVSGASLVAGVSGSTFTETGMDPILVSPAMAIDGRVNRIVRIDIERTVARSAGLWQGQIYYSTSGHGSSENFTAIFPDISSRVTIDIDMHALAIGGTDWLENTIISLRLDFDDGQLAGMSPGGAFIIHSIEVGHYEHEELFVWSGSHHLTYDGNLYRGYGYLSTIGAMKKTDGTEHIEQPFELNGIDPAILTDLDTSVRGLGADIWLAAIGPDRQIIREPVKVSTLVQDTLGWSYSLEDGSVTLRLVTYDALPLLGRATGSKFSYEDQQARYAGDEGFYFNSKIALQGQAVKWTLA